MNHLDRVREEFTRQADTFAVHAVNADQQVETRFQSAIGDAGVGNILDVACGPGVVTAALAARATNVIALDTTPAMLEKARQRCTDCGHSNVSFREGDAQNIPFEDEKFDGVVTRLAIHHFDKPHAVISEIFRVLKPDGRAIIVDVVVSDDEEEAALQNAIEIIRDPSHIRMLAEAELIGLIYNTGFEISKISGWDADREFEEWTGIANDPQRIGPLRTICRTLAKDGRHAGFGLSINQANELVFFHRWRMIIAEKPTGLPSKSTASTTGG